MIYIFLRVAAVPFLLLTYIIYQVLIKKKKLAEIQTDILYAAFFCAVYFGLYYLLMR